MLANLKFTLAARGVRQIDFALSEGISPTLLSEVVNQRRQASPELRVRIARALRTSEEWLFKTDVHVPEPKPQKPAECVAAAR